MKYTVEELRRWNCDTQIDGLWVSARSINHKYESWWQRLKHAWLVLVGKYDAVQ